MVSYFLRVVLLKKNMIFMHVLKDPEENTASENSPGHDNVKIYIFRARGTFWETRFAFLRQVII